MNTVSDHLSNQFVDAHGNQKLFLPDASLSFNFKPDSKQQQQQQQYNMSNLVTMPQFCMVMDSPQYGNSSNSMQQNMGYSDSVPIIDLSQKSDEPFVLCKLPVHIYNRVVEMIHNSKEMEGVTSPTPSVSTPIHANTSATSPLHLSSNTPYMTPQNMHTPLPAKQQLQLHMTPVNGMSTPPPTPNVSTPLKTPTSLLKDDEYHIKGSWTEEEDKKLVDLVKKYGAKRWSFIASHLKGRIGKQCRERYLNHLDPKINKKAWTNHEDSIIVEMHNKHGNQWAKISRMLPGRTANAIKNHWNSTLSRRLEKLKRSPGDSNGEEDSLEDNESGDESFDGHDSIHHVMINPPPLPHTSGPYSGTSSSSTTRVLGGFNSIGGPITTTTNNGQIMDMPKFEVFPQTNPQYNSKKRLRLDEESEDMHNYDHQDEDMHSEELNEHPMEELAEEQEDHQNKRFKPHVLDLTQSHSINDSKLKIDAAMDERMFSPFVQQAQPAAGTKLPLKSPSQEQSNDSSAQKYKGLTLNLDDGTNHDFDFSVICHNNYDCGLNLAEDTQGTRRASIGPQTPSNLSSTGTPSNLSTPNAHAGLEYFSDSLWSPKSVKNSGVKGKNFVATCTS